eukprot:g4857.t1
MPRSRGSRKALKNSMGARRLAKEYINLQKALKDGGTSFFTALPDPENIFSWHFVIFGDELPDERYKGGVYHGCIEFPEAYPLKAPSIMMISQSGRFQTNTKLCMSNTDFHPESWNPIWSVHSILCGFVSFFVDDTSTYGAITSSLAMKRKLAAESMLANSENVQFRKFFPELMEKYEDRIAVAKVAREQGKMTHGADGNARSSADGCCTSIPATMVICGGLAIFSALVGRLLV